MTTLTIHLDNEKSEQAIKAVLDALGVRYDEVIEQSTFPDHVVAGVRKAQKDFESGHLKKYKGLDAILNNS